jgi:hypothetical protein
VTDCLSTCNTAIFLIYLLTAGLVIAIPFALLSNIKKIATRKKVILYTLFSVEIITVVMSIIRCVISTRGLAADKGLQIRVILLLTHIETNIGRSSFRLFSFDTRLSQEGSRISSNDGIAITVACVGSLRSLFTQDDRKKGRAYDPPTIQPLRTRGNELQRDEFEAVTDVSLESRERSDSMAVPLTQLSGAQSRAESVELSATSRG